MEGNRHMDVTKVNPEIKLDPSACGTKEGRTLCSQALKETVTSATAYAWEMRRG